MSGGTESETTNTPWGPYKDLHKMFAGLTEEQYGQAQQFFPGQTVEGQSADTALSYDMLREFTTGNNTANAAGAFAGQVLGGEFMPGAEGNPYLDDVFDQLSRKTTEAYQRTVMPTLNSRFAGAGRSGSFAAGGARRDADRTLSRELGGLATEVYYGDYERRMGDRMQMAGMAPGINQSQLTNIGGLRALGQDQETYQQRLIQDAIARFQFNQNEPEARLDRFGQRIGVGGGFGTQTAQGGGGNAGLSMGLGILGLLGNLGGPAVGALTTAATTAAATI